MPIEKIDILLMKDLIKEIDVTVQRIEKKVKSCEVHGIIIDFEAANEFIKKTEHMIAEMRMKEPENKEILEMTKNLVSIHKRYSDARFDFENKCICIHKDKIVEAFLEAGYPPTEIKKFLSKYIKK